MGCGVMARWGRNKLLAGLTGAFCIVGVFTSAAVPQHLVFAHYMVCFATYGETVDAYKREIQEAQAAGIDGFALNVGAWDDVQLYYKTRVALMYNAAEQLGTGFKLFFSVDFENATNTVAMVESYASRTNTFRYQNRIVLSSYGHNDVPSKGWVGVDWTNAIVGKLKQDGYPVFFIPYFFSDPVQELPDYSCAQNVLQKYGNLLDGVFLFTAAGLPAQLASCNSNYNAAVHAASKPFMASVAPTYWGCGQTSIGRRYFEFSGGEGLIAQWGAIITNQPDWVEICTWNDFNESTYISPVNNPGQYSADLQSPVRYCHAGYANICKYFINLYKTGVNATNDNDAFFYFYRTHPKSAVASNTNEVPVTWFIGSVTDTVYASVFLTAPAVLEVNSGGLRSTNSLSAGASSVETPFSPGPQQFTLTRSNQTLLSIQGPDILSQIQVYDFFTASGSIYYRPNPPVNFRTIGL